MLRVANRGILFKVYRGVPLFFAMTPLAAGGCVVAKRGAVGQRYLAPHVPSEVPQAPTRSFSLFRRMSLFVPPEVPSPRPSAALRCLRTQKRSRVVVAPWGLLSAGPCSWGHRSAVKILQATIAFRLKMSLDIPVPHGLPLRRRCLPRPPSGICLLKQYCPAQVGTVRSQPSP